MKKYLIRSAGLLFFVFAVFSCTEEVVKSDYDYTQNASNAPTGVTTKESKNITPVGATVLGQVTANPNLDDWGIVYYTDEMKNAGKFDVVSAKDTSLVYDYSVVLGGLVPDTDYKYKAFAMNTDGITYGEEMALKTKPATAIPFSIAATDPVANWQAIQFTRIDADGDGQNWGLDYLNTDKTLVGYRSFSWNNTALKPENYLVLPPIQMGSASAKVTFTTAAGDADYFAEKYKVVISDAPITDAITARAAQVIGTHTMASAAKVSKTFAIPDKYKGKVIWIGIAHFDVTDFYVLYLMGISVE